MLAGVGLPEVVSVPPPLLQNFGQQRSGSDATTQGSGGDDAPPTYREAIALTAEEIKANNYPVTAAAVYVRCYVCESETVVPTPHKFFQCGSCMAINQTPAAVPHPPAYNAASSMRDEFPEPTKPIGFFDSGVTPVMPPTPVAAPPPLQLSHAAQTTTVIIRDPDGSVRDIVIILPPQLESQPEPVQNSYRRNEVRVEYGLEYPHGRSALGCRGCTLMQVPFFNFFSLFYMLCRCVARSHPRGECLSPYDRRDVRWYDTTAAKRGLLLGVLISVLWMPLLWIEGALLIMIIAIIPTSCLAACCWDADMYYGAHFYGTDGVYFVPGGYGNGGQGCCCDCYAYEEDCCDCKSCPDCCQGINQCLSVAKDSVMETCGHGCQALCSSDKFQPCLQCGHGCGDHMAQAMDACQVCVGDCSDSCCDCECSEELRKCVDAVDCNLSCDCDCDCGGCDC